jgi:hypothetical protein
MAKTRHNRSRRHKQRGGELAGNPPSAWGWALGTAGNGWNQFMNSLTLHPGESQVAAKSNDLVPNKMSGGKRRSRSRSRSRSRKGGNLGAVLNQAAVPLVLLGANQVIGKKLSKRTRKH